MRKLGASAAGERMLQPDNLEQALVFAGKALETMTGRSVPPTPPNFTLWYAYHTGRMPDLRRSLDVLIETGRPLTPELTQELHDQFFGHEREANALRETGQQIETALATVLGILGDADKGAGRYGKALETLSGQLAGATGAGEVRKLVAGALEETRRMQEQNQALQDQVKQSTGEIAQLRRDLDSVKREAMTDALTGIANRKYFDIALQERMRCAFATGAPLCLLMLDIDHFKRFNDSYGHQLGDQVLKLVARTLTDTVKGRDLAARYGGEEFAVILPETALRDAVTLADKIRLAVASRRIVKKSTGEELGTITMSIGAAEYLLGEQSADWIRRADMALYAAKRGGRNRVVADGVPTRRAQRPDAAA
jgi:diguanylate cyclase